MNINMVASLDAIPERANTGFEFDKFPRGGVVYLIEGNDGRVKVGRTSQPRHRITAVCRGAGVRHGRIAFTDAVLNSSSIEAEFKNHYRSSCVNGEWFIISIEKAVDFLSGCGAIRDDAEAAQEAEVESKRCEAGRMAILREFYPTEKRPEVVSIPNNYDERSAQMYIDLAVSIWGVEAAHQLWEGIGRKGTEPTHGNAQASIDRIMNDDDDFMEAA